MVTLDAAPPASNASTCDFKYAVLFARFFSGALAVPDAPPEISAQCLFELHPRHTLLFLLNLP